MNTDEIMAEFAKVREAMKSMQAEHRRDRAVLESLLDNERRARGRLQERVASLEMKAPA